MCHKKLVCNIIQVQIHMLRTFLLIHVKSSEMKHFDLGSFNLFMFKLGLKLFILFFF